MSRLHPGIPGAVVRASDEIYATTNGPVRGVHMTVPEETWEEYRQGYRCIKCHAAQRTAFPEECVEPYCRFNLARDQMKWIEFDFRGSEALWPETRFPEAGERIWTPYTPWGNDLWADDFEEG